MNEDSLRVALLARAGEACDRIGEALREAGADVVLVADPLASSESAVRQARPQAIMVALEPAVEEVLERFDTLLTDPEYMVIFEEAELAAQRAGWDAARWIRHLSAKLHRHNDVLPPGAESDDDLQPSPGPLPPRVVEVDFDEAIAAFADEAHERASEVPRDAISEPLPPEEPSSPFDPVAFEVADIHAVERETPLLRPGAEQAPALVDDPFAVAPGWSGEAGEGAESPDSAAVPSVAEGGLALVDDPFVVPADGLVADGAAGAGGGDAPTEKAASSVDAFDTGGLSLALDDGPIEQAGQRPAKISLEDLESRIAGLSLADEDSYGHGPERGAVLVEAGLGGPDAVRQLLAAIPAEFPRPVLVRLQLDGGRYDRLVKQMERVSQLPVALAEDGGTAERGTVYFLPPGIGLRRERGELRFDASADGEGPLPPALPPADSAVLLLSGASRRVADATTAEGWDAALVAGQSPDSAYDPDAALALLERGGRVGAPAELAAMLVERWMPQHAIAPDIEDPLA